MKTIYIKNIKPNWNMLKHHVGKDYIKYSLNMYDILKFNNKSNYLITSNIKNNELSNLKLSYQNLKIDLINNNIPTRSRKYCNYRLDVRNKNEFKLGIVDSDIFVQNTNDNRNIPRKFQLIDKEIILSNWLTDYIGNIAALALLNKNDSKIKYCNVYTHQVRQIVTKDTESHNSPEGIHRDGVDYIVSAFVINKFNVNGGKSIIYDKNKNKIFETTLEENQGIFQEDKELYHYVEKINVIDDNYFGYRDILGFDILFE
tara:strand:- start:106 stop:879 length:774 start_codon:yes stop_codon:yes gene_type:complete